MGEIKLVKVKGCYGDLKGKLGQLPSVSDMPFTETYIVDAINAVVDRLTEASETDYSMHKIIDKDIYVGSNPLRYDSNAVRFKVGGLMGRLEEEYGLGSSAPASSSAPHITILNQNQNDIAISINYTIASLIEAESSNEAKDKLTILDTELKEGKSWDVIKPILLWLLEFSKDLFLKVLPIILKSAGGIS